LRKIIFIVIILLALLLAVEVGVTLLSEHGVERVIRSQYGLPDNLQVSINSFPLTLSLLRNHLAEVRIYWEDELGFAATGGVETSAPYYGQVAVYDIELNMPSLLRGRLDIKKISHMRTAIVFGESSVNKAFGLGDQGFKIEDGEIYTAYGGIRINYKVKVSEGNVVTIEPQVDSSVDIDSQANPQSGINIPPLEISFYAMPFDAKLEKVRVEGDKVILEISIPMWEGYL
jgi:translation initiation factor IF-1